MFSSQSIYSSNGAFRLAVVGDLHTHWDHVDLRQFAGTDYDLLFFTGDLGGGTPDSTLRVARAIGKLSKPALVMPGNNDTCDINQLAAELAHQNGLNRLMSITSASEDDFTPIELCGYSHHGLNAGGFDVSLIAARPHSMGGPSLSFPDYMAQTYAVESLDHSIARLIGLVDAAHSENLIFLAHNGPVGMGENPHDMWGCDFKEGGGDWGDPDLTEAISYARKKGRKVLAVIGGHMHIRTKQGKERPWISEQDEILYINAARVPRIYSGEDDVYRHHVSLTISADGLGAEEILLPEYG
ncbi:MAG: metallophosphoesterase [Gammaproteobacteria bacterium]|nr:metallophosphoesterase [Gammaproteobacteria bacterium]